MPRGYIYILSNKGMPKLLKIGKTCAHPIDRAKDLYRTGVPFPYKVCGSWEVDDVDEAEKTVHATLQQKRVNPEREFFCCTRVEALKTIEEALSKRKHFVIDATSV